MTDNESADLALTVYAPAEPAEADEPRPEEGGDLGSAAQGIALAAERDRLARALRDTHRQLAAAESQLMSVKRSATMGSARPSSPPPSARGSAARGCPSTCTGCGGSAGPGAPRA